MDAGMASLEEVNSGVYSPAANAGNVETNGHERLA